ncbi:MAG: hypothetical protein HYU58_08195 [Proteobacteria bacterium]|nr:hypothetical protein [Pseudomonadota bacterium]
MFALTLKSRNLSLWNSLARAFRLARHRRAGDIDRLSVHMLRDLGISQNEAVDLLAAERTRFLS